LHILSFFPVSEDFPLLSGEIFFVFESLLASRVLHINKKNNLPPAGGGAPTEVPGLRGAGILKLMIGCLQRAPLLEVVAPRASCRGPSPNVWPVESLCSYTFSLLSFAGGDLLGSFTLQQVRNCQVLR